MHSERLLQPLCTVLHSGPVPHKRTVPPQIKKRKSPCHFLHRESLRFFSYSFFLVSSSFLWASHSSRSLLVSSSFYTARSSVKSSSCRSSSSFSLRVTKLLFGFHPPFQTHENRQQTAGKVLPNPIHGDSRNLMPRKVNVFNGLVDVTVLPKLLQGCSRFITRLYCLTKSVM